MLKIQSEQHIGSVEGAGYECEKLHISKNLDLGLQMFLIPEAMSYVGVNRWAAPEIVYMLQNLSNNMDNAIHLLFPASWAGRTEETEAPRAKDSSPKSPVRKQRRLRYPSFLG